MNILLINHYAGSPDMGMEFRPYYMAREWVKSGHKVTIIAGDYSHLRTQNPNIDADFTEEIIDGIGYCWVKTGVYHGNGVKRAVSMANFSWKLWIRARWLSKKYHPDIVIASSTYPIDTYAAQRIRKFSRAKYVHEIHDMWPITPIEIGNMSKYNPFIVVMQMGENSFCRNADKIVSLLPNSKQYLIEHGMIEDKFACIPNGIVIEDWNESEELPDQHKELFDRLKKEEKLIIGFFGSNTKSYALSYLIDAVSQIENDKICAVLVGNGVEKQNLIKYAEKAKDRIYFLPPVKKRCIPSLLEAMDILYIGAVNNKMFRFGICMNKLFDSMMSGKPVLYAVNAPNNYIQDYKCGICVEPESAIQLIDGITKFVNMSDEDKKILGNNGKNAVMRYFNYGVISKRFEDVFLGLLDQKD